MIFICNRLISKFLSYYHVKAMAIFPLLLLENKSLKDCETIIRHEKIHFRQQLELLIIPFYLIYCFEYLYYYLKWKDKNNAYHSISFEKEAYKNEDNIHYLKNRPLFAMWLSTSSNEV